MKKIFFLFILLILFVECRYSYKRFPSNIKVGDTFTMRIYWIDAPHKCTKFDITTDNKKLCTTNEMISDAETYDDIHLYVIIKSKKKDEYDIEWATRKEDRHFTMKLRGFNKFGTAYAELIKVETY